MPRPKILVVDNDKDFFDLTLDFFQKQKTLDGQSKYDLIWTQDREEAKELILQRKVDMAFLDIRLTKYEDEKDRTGLTLLRETSGDGTVPKVVISKFTTFEYAREVMSAPGGTSPPALYYIDKKDWDVWEQMLRVIEKTLMRANIFLCYAREDIEKVTCLYNTLQEIGHSPWMDVRNLVPGQNWHNMIRQEITQTDFFIVCLTRNCADPEEYMLREIRWAMEIQEGKRDSDVFLIPARLEDCSIGNFAIRAWQWIDLFDEKGDFSTCNLRQHVGFTKLSTSIIMQMRRRWKQV